MSRDPDSTPLHRMTRRSLLASLALAPLALSACNRQIPSTAPPLEANSFPVTVDHHFGSTTIKSMPQRIVSLGPAGADVLIALGVIPAGMSQSGAGPWISTAITALRAPSPFLFDDTAAIPFDTIANIAPDLILATDKIIAEEDYASLRNIAPTIGPKDAAPTYDWTGLVPIIASVIGRKKAGQDLIERTSTKIAGATTNYPTLAKASVLFLSATATIGADLVVYGTNSYPMQALTEFKLQPGPALDALAGASSHASDAGTQYFVPVGDAHTLAASVVAIHASANDQIKFLASKELAQIPATRHNGVYYLTDDEAHSLDCGGPLALSWACDNVVPELAKFAYFGTQMS